MKATYRGYTGISYGTSSYSVYDPEGVEVFHTGFLRHPVRTQEECLKQLKSCLVLIDSIDSIDSMEDEE